MSACHLAGGASTNSRGSRPLPPGAVSARVLSSFGATEIVEFTFADGRVEQRQLLSWTVGQHGCLWAFSPPADWLHKHAGRMPSSYGHRDEWALAETLGEIYDGRLTSNDLAVRFALGGSDACDMAVRLARAATGRMPVCGYGYHGHTDSVSHEPATAGILPENYQNYRRFEWGDTTALAEKAQDAAAAIVEVPAVDDDTARSFLETCRVVCDVSGALLIIDDVVLGARLGIAGSLSAYGVKPDLVVLGKAISAVGLCSAVVGRADVVNLLGGGCFYSGTFFGHPGVVAIANETLRWLMKNADAVFRPAGHLFTLGKALQDGYNALGIACIGQPERSAFSFPTDADWLGFCSAMIGYGYGVHRPNFPTLRHRELDVKLTLQAAEKALAR